MLIPDKPFRIQPSTPVTAMKTYALRAPLGTHFRKATCEEYGCPDYLGGFRATLDERDPDQKFRADYIRKESGRGFTEEHDEHGRTVFTFHPGQMCFHAADHHVRIQEQPTLCLVRDGDWRGNPTGHSRPLSEQDLIDDSGETFERLADKLKEG